VDVSHSQHSDVRSTMTSRAASGIGGMRSVAGSIISEKTLASASPSKISNTGAITGTYEERRQILRQRKAQQFEATFKKYEDEIKEEEKKFKEAMRRRVAQDEQKHQETMTRIHTSGKQYTDAISDFLYANDQRELRKKQQLFQMWNQEVFEPIQVCLTYMESAMHCAPRISVVDMFSSSFRGSVLASAASWGDWARSRIRRSVIDAGPCLRNLSRLPTRGFCFVIRLLSRIMIH
jgi:hypothetical protein